MNENGIDFINSKNSKISDSHEQLLNLIDKINLKRSDKYIALSNLSIYYPCKNKKKSHKHNKKIEQRLLILQ